MPDEPEAGPDPAAAGAADSGQPTEGSSVRAASPAPALSDALELPPEGSVADAYHRRARLAELCGNQAHIAQAPVFLAWCADLSRLDRICQARNHTHVAEYVENFLLSTVDAAIVMQNAALAAESLGLGMCYIGAIRNRSQDVIDLLHLPRHGVQPVLVHPDERAPQQVHAVQNQPARDAGAAATEIALRRPDPEGALVAAES